MATTTSSRTGKAAETGSANSGSGGSATRSGTRRTSASTSRKGASTISKGAPNYGVVAASGAVGMALGVLAMIGRKVAVQAPTYLAGDWDVALAAEHKATLKLFDALQATNEKDTGKRAMLLTQLKHALAKHALEEENAIYPALRDAGMKAEADELNQEHGYVKQYLYDLGNMPNASSDYLPMVARFRRDIEHHIREEEDQLFPALKARLSPEKNHALTQAMNKEGFKLA